MIQREVRTVLLVIAVSFTFLAPAYAQPAYGVRAGVSADPDQFFIGGHVESPPLGDMGRLTFRPNVEIGFGNSITTVAGNVEAVGWVPFPNSAWSAYLGGGPAVIFRHDDFEHRAHGGFNLLIGFQHSGGIFAELKTGFNDSHRLKAIVGYSFRVVRAGAPAPGTAK